MKDACIIPVLNPDKCLINITKDLKKNGFDKIIVVNDGSSSSYDKIFNQLDSSVIVLRHDINLGKGAAIKTAIKYVKDNLPLVSGVITIDGDGQHAISDVVKISNALINNRNNKIILGIRDFNKKNVPKKSYLGNKFSIKYFKFVTGIYLSDTQTGLRGIPKKFFDLALETDGNRYEYEMNFLINAAKEKIEFIEIPIETIYKNKNRGSHFRPFKDAILIYKKPIKFVLSSLFCAILDLTIFGIISYLINSNLAIVVTISTIVSRVISGIVNFFLNKKWCFESKRGTTKEAIKYLALFIIQMLLSILLVSIFSSTKDYLIIIKIIIDCILFVGSYYIQKKYIFN